MPNTKRVMEEAEQKWQIKLPESFWRLHGAFERPFVSPCEFIAAREFVGGSERWQGMLPQFVPFGHNGTDDWYGFYVTPTTGRSDFPVLYWDHEYDHYYPISSSFNAFLRWCVIHGRYLAQDSGDENDPVYGDEEAQRREFTRLAGLPTALLREPSPRNERELYERLAASDPQSAHALAQLGSIWLGRGDMGRTRDFFVRASEAAPWFADPYYLIAETFAQQGHEDEAISRWWQVLLCPIALSTRTANYDLGETHVEAEIYEAAADQLSRRIERVPASIRQHPLGELALEGDPFDAGERLKLVDALRKSGDTTGAERELLNALALSTEDEHTQAAYTALVALYEAAGRQRDAAFCRADRQR